MRTPFSDDPEDQYDARRRDQPTRTRRGPTTAFGHIWMGFMDESEARNIEVVRKYFEGCNSGDIDQLMSTIAHDVTHYFLSSSSSPIRGAAHLAEYWKSWKQDLDPVWAHDHLIARGDEVVAEWSVIFTPPGTQKRLMNRGTEWYVMRDSRILEVRAYFIADPECLYPPPAGWGIGD